MDSRNTVQHGEYTSYAGSALQKGALLAGIAFLIVGVAGFIPGLTTSAEHLAGAGAASEAHLFGLFQVSVLHNVVHLAYGVAGIASAVRVAASRIYLVLGGVVYLLVWVYGLLAVANEALNLLPVNHADNWLHLGLAAAMILLGVFLHGEPRLSRTRAAAQADGSK
ncbi:DUF4383 domain-containing protein [Microbacterium hydrocarbonoxydans]|uniref:DUF4383 domain-containing protein n=1 Tax=Microbacterium hydrocarbonoxydans TaxID=273678 RepID=UPI0007BC6FDF|nr:DUF4383 domain-containing protein [Microbacterium hydrocarbonoxydans]GAT72003.1 hypothetical protein MHM582_0472 [Microbacterium sp. HM58-2]